MKKYIYGFDLSMSCTGISIFSNDGKLILVTSVDTKSGKNHQMKLKLIADKMIELREKYPPEKIVIERGFYKFMASTETVFRVHGLCQYLFWDVEQIYYPPATIKKEVSGAGNAKKEKVRDVISNLYPKIKWTNLDETDAVSIGLCYFYKAGTL